MSTGKGLQTLRTLVVPSLARSGRRRRVVILGPFDPKFELFISSQCVTTQKAWICRSSSYFLSSLGFEDSHFETDDCTA